MKISGLLFTWFLIGLTESVTVSLPPNVTVTIQRSVTTPSPPCYICSKPDDCKLSKLHIYPGTTVSYTFSCASPEQHFVMSIQRIIDCNTGVCPFGNVILQPAGLSTLNKTFSWHVGAPRSSGLELKFTPWLRQINPLHKCRDRLTFTVSTSAGAASTKIGTFCKKGTISRIKLQGGGIVTLEVPWNETLSESGFSIANRSSIKRMCIIESIFETESTITLMSPNYPQGFPNKELITWQFIVPSNHRATVQFTNYSKPSCFMKEERVEYDLPLHDTNPEVFQIDGTQPGNIAGNFNLSLENCELESQNPGALTLLFNVTVQKGTIVANQTYPVDLRGERTMNVRISKKTPFARFFAPVCKVCNTHVCSEDMVLEGGRYYRITFLCNNLKNLMVSAEQVTACTDLNTCNVKNKNLTVPQSLLHLPVRLESVTWKIVPPPKSSTEITSRRAKLFQSVPGKDCNTTRSGSFYNITSLTNDNRLTFGTFCPNGSIEKMQMKGNVTMILYTGNQTNLPQLNHDLQVSFVPSVKEEGLFTVSPNSGSTVHLHTLNWDEGLPDYFYLSWSVELSSKQSAQLTFDRDKMGIMCQMNSALLHVKEKRTGGVDVVLKEDEKLPSVLNLKYPFWVNISNCKPKDNYKFRIQFSITVMESNTDVTIIGIIVGAVLGTVIAAVGVTVFCLKKRKKKRTPFVKSSKPKVNSEVSRRKGFKGRKGNESHIYDVIDDTIVYGHLLKHNDGPTNPEVDVYRPFEGPIDNVPCVPPHPVRNGTAKEDAREDSFNLSMRRNEIYDSSDNLPREPVEDEDLSLSYPSLIEQEVVSPS